ncbi:MAG: ATP-binding cassette domain-containing protein [Acidobacteria bacterium]|nr:ATP-binding cassette domain-containing protein [Acidobacteriota bacterium]
MRSPRPPAISTVDLTRRFDTVLAVDRVNLSVDAGTIFGLLGPNGAGKSTTIKMLTTLLPPSSGSAQVAGADIRRQPRVVRGAIGYVPQLVSADGGLTGVENMALSAALYDIPLRARGARIRESLAFMGLAEAAHQLVRTYSGGMVRRLEIAQGLLHRPAVLFLDEPTIGLDPIARHAVWDRLQETRRRFDTTVLITTHDMEEADVLCDRLAIMHRGQVVVAGTPSELKERTGAGASLGDVFSAFAGATIANEGSFGDIARTRRTASRLG